MMIIQNIFTILCIFFAGYNFLTLQNNAQHAEVIAAKLNVRSGPSEGDAIVFQLKRGDKITIGETKGNWCSIEEAAGLMPRRGWVSSRYLSTERDDKVNLFYTKSDVAYMAQEVRQSLITTGIIYMLLGLVIGVTNMRDYYGYNLLIWGGALLSVIDVVFLISSNTNPFVSFGILSVSSAYALILPVMLLLLSNFRITPFEICVGFTKTITIFGFTVFPLHLIDFLFPIRPFVQTIIAEVTG